MNSMRVGILTGGGDCPGLNAVIRAAVRKGIFHHSDQLLGFLEGWRGVMDDMTMPLDLNAVAGILPRGGTILRTSRTNPAKKKGGLEACIHTIQKHSIEAIISIGGDDTQSVALKLHDRGGPVVAVSQTTVNNIIRGDHSLCFILSLKSLTPISIS